MLCPLEPRRHSVGSVFVPVGAVVLRRHQLLRIRLPTCTLELMKAKYARQFFQYSMFPNSQRGIAAAADGALYGAVADDPRGPILNAPLHIILNI